MVSSEQGGGRPRPGEERGRRWTGPELRVLTREPPEESVLSTCKTGWYGHFGSTPQGIQNECIMYQDCASCAGWAAS